MIRKHTFETGQLITAIYKIIGIDEPHDKYTVQCTTCNTIYTFNRKQVTDRIVSNSDYCNKCPKEVKKRRLSGARASTAKKDRALTDLDRKVLNSNAYFG